MILHIDKFSGVNFTLYLVRILKKTVGLFVVLNKRELIYQERNDSLLLTFLMSSQLSSRCRDISIN